MDNAYETYLPEAHAAQEAAIIGNPYRIPHTAFTTGAVNNNAVMTAHRDKNNWRGAYSVQTMLRAGDFEGGLLVFPRYRLACEMSSGDVLFFSGDELHGVTTIEGEEGTYERITVVAYCRDGLVNDEPLDPYSEGAWIADELGARTERD